MAPAKGVVKAIFPGGHAIGITTDSGVELLIHIGLETVNLKGEGFISHIQQGDVIKEGQLLIEFDECAEKNCAGESAAFSPVKTGEGFHRDHDYYL